MNSKDAISWALRMKFTPFAHASFSMPQNYHLVQFLLLLHHCTWHIVPKDVKNSLWKTGLWQHQWCWFWRLCLHFTEQATSTVPFFGNHSKEEYILSSWLKAQDVYKMCIWTWELRCTSQFHCPCVVSGTSLTKHWPGNRLMYSHMAQPSNWLRHALHDLVF